jgi:hypothetical protein
MRTLAWMTIVLATLVLWTLMAWLANLVYTANVLPP